MVYFTDEFENFLYRTFGCGSKNPFELDLTVDMIKVSHGTKKIYYDEYDRPYDGDVPHVIYFGLEKTHFSTPSESIKLSPKDAILVSVKNSDSTFLVVTEFLFGCYKTFDKDTTRPINHVD
jgi:hypothetical protein